MTTPGQLRLHDRTWVAVQPITALLGDSPVDQLERERRASRALLRLLLRQFDADEEPIGVRPGGQPHLPGRPDLAISISHTSDWVAAAVQVASGDRGPAVGVDVETPRTVGDRLVARCTSAETRRLLGFLPRERRMHEFTTIWTVQEACVKAEGTGLAGRPWTIPVGVGQRTGRWQDYRWRSLREAFPVPVSCAFQEDR